MLHPHTHEILIPDLLDRNNPNDLPERLGLEGLLHTFERDRHSNRVLLSEDAIEQLDRQQRSSKTPWLVTGAYEYHNRIGQHALMQVLKEDGTPLLLMAEKSDPGDRQWPVIGLSVMMLTGRTFDYEQTVPDPFLANFRFASALKLATEIQNDPAFDAVPFYLPLMQAEQARREQEDTLKKAAVAIRANDQGLRADHRLKTAKIA